MPKTRMLNRRYMQTIEMNMNEHIFSHSQLRTAGVPHITIEIPIHCGACNVVRALVAVHRTSSWRSTGIIFLLFYQRYLLSFLLFLERI